jgi:hypothetical protein
MLSSTASEMQSEADLHIDYPLATAALHLFVGLVGVACVRNERSRPRLTRSRSGAESGVQTTSP